MQLVVDKFGRVVLPKALREGHGLVAGERVDVEDRPECVILRPARQRSVVTQRDGLLVFSGQPEGDLTQALARHRRERIGRESAPGRKR